MTLPSDDFVTIDRTAAEDVEYATVQADLAAEAAEDDALRLADPIAYAAMVETDHQAFLRDLAHGA